MADTATTSTFDKWAKEVFPFGDDYWKQFNQATPALDLINSTNKVPFFGKHEGKYIVVPAMTAAGANDAVPFGEESGLSRASKETVDRLKYNVAMHNSSIKITGLAMDTMIGGDQSVQNELDFLMMQRPKSFNKQMNYYLHGTGSGLLANVVSVSGNTITVDDATQLPVDRDIIIRNKTTGGLSGSGQTANYALTVTVQNTSTNVITVAREDGTAVTLTGQTSVDAIYPYDSQGKAMNGFGIMCSTANPTDYGSSTAYFGTVDRAANPWWQGNGFSALDSSGNTQAFDMFRDLQPAIDGIEKRAQEFLDAKSVTDNNGNDFTVRWYAFTGRQNWRALGNQMKRDQRTDGGSNSNVSLKGGWKGIDYEGCVFVVDNDAPPSKIRMMHFASIKRYDVRPVYWDDRTGAIWIRKTASDGRDADIFKAYMLYRGQMIAVQCLTHGEITGLSATA